MIERVEQLEDALRDILDVTTHWTRNMTMNTRIERIDSIARTALNVNKPPAEAEGLRSPQRGE